MHNIVSCRNSIRQKIELKFNTSIDNDKKPLARRIIKQILLLGPFFSIADYCFCYTMILHQVLLANF